MGKSSYREKRLAGQVSLALAAGMFSVVPVAHGMPTLDPAAPHTGGTPDVTVSYPDTSTMNVNGSRTNNVIDWKDFSVKAGETVAFQKVDNLPANYMNIVTGNATSNIEGRITNAGDIYLINPHGVIFGKGAKVDVGNLYVSTREANSVDIAGFKGGTASGESVLSVAASPTTDVVNLIDSTTNGYVRAEKVVMEGRNIRFLDSSSVIQAGTGTVNETTGVLTGGTANAESANLVLRSNNFDGTNGYIHVGDASGNYVYTTNKKNGNTPVIGNVGNTGNDKKEKEDQGVVNYALVRDAAGLNSINNNGGNANSGIGLAGNYMLADDITNAGTVQIGTGNTSGAGNAFTGKFDGMFKTVSGLSQSGNTKYLGLFGHTSGARIENVGVKNAQLTGMYAGSIVGYAENSTKLLNVWNEGGGSTYIGPTAYGQFTGGLVGTLKSSELKNSYNAGAVHGAGLVSQLQGSSTIEDSYNIGATKAYSNKIYGLVRLAGDSNDKIINSYSAAAYLNGATDPEVFSDSGTYTNSYIIKSTTSYKHGSQTVNDTYTLTKNTTGLYSNWSISSEGGANTIWRIYEGASLPLLNSFMKAKGTVAAEYSYDKNGVTTQSVNDTSSKVYSATKVAPTDIVLYGANGAAQQATDGTAVKNLTGTQFAVSTRKDVYTGSGTTATKFALLYGGQQGYDLYGNNFTITKRSVLFTPGDNPEFTKVYDGTPDAKAALASALSGATSGTTGFLAADQQYVTDEKVGFTFSNIDANYTDKNVGTGKTITVSETAGQTASVSLTATDTNYQYIVDNYDVTGNLNDMFGTYASGVITARPVLVDLTTKTGINKVYDGTSDVTKDGCVGAENLTASGIDGNTASGLVSGDHAMLSATSVYVDASGNETKNVAGTTGAVGVAYKDIVATDTDGNTGNYAFYYKVGENLVAVNDSPLTAGGTITPRTISKDDLVLKDAQGNEMGTTEKPITKTYNGTTTKSLGDGTTAAYASGAIIDNNTDAGKATAKSTETGLLATDAANMTFASTGTVTFYKSDGETQTSFATANGGAQRAGFGVELTVTDDSILTNYQWSDAVGSELATGVDKVGVNGTGVINKREITVAPKWDSGIDKVYDGDSNVKDVAGGNAYATGNYKITSGSLVEDATTSSTPTLGITSATYSSKDVEYEGTTAKAKTIAYTIALSGSGNVAGNYNLNSTGTTTATLNSATGTITPKELTVTFDDVTKPYDTTADVIGAINPTWDGLVTGDSHTDSAISGKYVAKNATTGNYEEASDVGSYLNDGTKAVMYTGILDALGENAKNYKINGKHYTLSNTEYGKGYITARKISLDQLKSYLDPKGNLTKTYDATANYTHDMVTANQLAASDYLQVDTNAINTAIGAHTLMDGAATDIQAVIDGKLTIASAIYNGVDAGNYTNVSMTFNMDGTGKTQDTGDQKYYITVGNYDFEWAESFSDATSGTPESTGRTGTITPKGLTVTVANATKIYDGTQNVKAAGVVVNTSSNTFKSWFTFSDMVGNETVTLANGATATYDDKNASDSDKTITYEHLALANGTNGGKAENYKIVDSQGNTINSITGVGTITRRTITLSDDYGTATKIYDGNANVTAFQLKAANNTPTGENDSDWTVLARDGIVDNNTVTGLITKVGTSGDVIKGTYLATSGQGASETASGSDNGVAANVRRSTDGSRTVMNKDVTYSGFQTVFNPNNYIVKDAGGTTVNDTLTVARGGKITPEQINLNSVGANYATQEYNGKKEVLNASQWLTGVPTVDDGVLTITGEFTDSKNVGDNKPITYSIKVNDNASSINYDITGVNPGETKTISEDSEHNAFLGSITAKKIKAAINANEDAQRAAVVKAYDGKTNTAVDSSLTTWVQANNHGGQKWIIVDGDDTLEDEDGNTETVSINTGSATVAYDSGNAGNRTVTYGGLSLNVMNGDTNNYQLVDDSGNATTNLSGYGKITPKEVTFKPYNDDDTDIKFRKTYDGYSTFTTENNFLLGGAVQTWWEANAVAGDTFDTSVGALSGKYGTWDPTDGFTENSHVYTDETKTKKTSDVSYSLALIGDAAKNYKITNGTNIAGTVYFQEAMQGRGEIKPLSITMSAVEAEWDTPITKVYDGSDSVASYGNYVAYDVNGVPVTKSAADLLKIYYKPSLDNRLSDEAKANNPNVELIYDVTDAGFKAVYTDGADAGSGKAFQYSGLSYTTFDRGDYTIAEGETLQTTYTSPGVNKGSIAKRLLYVDADNTPLVNGDNTKIYDGGTNLVDAGTVYTASLKDAQNNPNASGLVGNDVVSMTYEANFADAAANIAPDTVKDGTAWTTKNVTYTFTLANQAGKDFAKNYTLVKNGDATSTTDTRGGAIRQREVYVDFKEGKGTGLDKTYDKTATALKDATMSDYVYLLDAVDDADTNTHTGVVTDEDVTLDFSTNGQKPTANYDDANVAFDNGTVTTKKVYIQNFNLTGTGASNYVVKAVKKTGDTADEGTLEGTGMIKQQAIDLAANNAPSKTYDTTNKVKMADETLYQGTRLADGDSYIKLADGSTLAPGDGGTVIADTLADVGIEVESALYASPDAGTGLGVTYTLKWDNNNYKLLHTTINTTGTIKPKTITALGTPTITKTYDGDDSVTNTPKLVQELFGDDVYEKDRASLLTIAPDSKFDRADVYADAADAAAHNAAQDVYGTLQGVTVTYTLNDAGSGKNYRLSDDDSTRTKTYTNDASDGLTGGRIDRAQVTMTPTEVSYYPSQLANARYTGTVASNGAAFNGNATFGRDENTSTAAGNYTLLGYVNGTRIGTGDTFVDGMENYYFRTTPNMYLHILAEPVSPDVPVVPDIPDIPGIDGKPVTQAVTETVISDKKFTPDDYSYNRISKDQDLTRLNRESSASVQYAEKGVNLDGGDTKSGLSALADIKGAGSVVNLEGAFIRTSAPAEQPETVAAEAALPVPETEESDISSISLEYAGDGDNSQALLEILTNASSNAEKKGTSIVIDAQDEDEEDAEEEKSRRAIFADRSNIGIETLGNAVNLNQMIG